jgi:hypothetical protein
MADLSDRLRRLIAMQGPIPLALYMAEANAHYYSTRDPLGAGGDFITAPEISQMFGEMVGVWLADVWRRAGAPARDLCRTGAGARHAGPRCLARGGAFRSGAGCAFHRRFARIASRAGAGFSAGGLARGSLDPARGCADPAGCQ